MFFFVVFFGGGGGVGEGEGTRIFCSVVLFLNSRSI